MDLKLCPFCKHAPKQTLAYGKQYIECSNKKCWMFAIMAHPDEWNNRAPSNSKKIGEVKYKCAACHDTGKISWTDYSNGQGLDIEREDDCDKCLTPSDAQQGGEVDVALDWKQQRATYYDPFMGWMGPDNKTPHKLLLMLDSLQHRLDAARPPTPSDAVNPDVSKFKHQCLQVGLSDAVTGPSEDAAYIMAYNIYAQKSKGKYAAGHINALREVVRALIAAQKGK